MPSSLFADAKVYLILGIANPQPVIQAVRALGISLDRLLIFADHHRYSEADLMLPDEAVVITTEKDAVKIADLRPKALYYLPLTLEINWSAIFPKH